MFQIETLDHVAITVRDVKASVAWYQEVLRLQRLPNGVWGDSPAVMGVGSVGIALFPVEGTNAKPRPGRDTLTMRHFAFRVSRQNFKQAKTALSARGISTTHQHHTISESIYFHDPDGHQIELTTYEM